MAHSADGCNDKDPKFAKRKVAFDRIDTMLDPWTSRWKSTERKPRFRLPVPLGHNDDDGEAKRQRFVPVRSKVESRLEPGKVSPMRL